SVFEELTYSSSLLLENNLEPTPLNYWKIHVAKFRTELRSCNPSDVVAQLLPSAMVSMTEYGLEYKGLYYTNSDIESRKFHSIARSSGQWQLEARIDENTTNFIYVRLDKNKGFVKCNLAERRKLFRDRSMIEADFVQDWLDVKKENTVANDHRKEVRKEVSKINKEAASRSKVAKITPFNQRKQGIRDNRKIEIERTTNIIDGASSASAGKATEPAKPVATSSVIPLPQGPQRNRKRNDDDN
ncbi:transposase, partial [Alkalimonas collagenimarina]|nr:transposase [Alkalimonas collagenimarina]